MIEIIIDDSDIKKAGLQLETFWNTTVARLFEKMSTEARDEIRQKTFSGRIRRTASHRQQAQKTEFYRNMFLASTTHQSNGDMRTRLNVRHLGENNTPPAGFAFGSSGFIKNLAGNVTIKAQSGSTLRIPSKKAEVGEITRKGSLKKLTGKKYFVLRKGDKSLPKKFSGIKNNNIMIFRREEDGTLALAGIAYGQATYNNPKEYKLNLIEQTAVKFFHPETGLFVKAVRMELEKEIQRKN